MDLFNIHILHVTGKLRTNEHVKAHEDALGIIKPDAANISEVQKSLNEYEQGVERMKLIFRHSPESSETKRIGALDVRRDTLWNGGKQIIKLYIKSLDEATRVAADEMRILMNAYGNVPHFSLYGETGSLKHAIDDFKKAGNQAKVALIPGLSALVGELETVNNELDTLYRKRFQEAEAVKQLGKLADSLSSTDKLLIAVFEALNTVYNYNEMTAKLPALKNSIERIATNIKALFDQLEKVLKHRHPGNKHDGPDNPGGEEGGEDGGGGEGNGDGFQEPDITNPPVPFE